MENDKNEEFDFLNELKEKMGLDELDNPTLYYYLQGFLDACDINVLEGDYVNNYIEGEEYRSYLLKKHSEDDLNYSIEIFRGSANKKDVFMLKGKYNDLDFTFYNFYHAKKLNEEIKQIRFSVNLEKKVNKNNYSMIAESIKGKTKFILLREPDNNDDFSDQICFYSNRDDFENTFGIIESFVQNPEFVFFAYKRIINSKSIVLNGKEIDFVKNNEDLLVTNQGKVLKKVLNNEN